jgi:hypothetical protein
MATHAEWAKGYARQALADYDVYQKLQPQEVPEGHKLLFLQMACEKLVKAHLCGTGTDPATLQTSHAYVAKPLPVLLRQHATLINFTGPKARAALQYAKHLCQEIELLAPAVRRGGNRPDNCEYPWEDAAGMLHVPLDWAFTPSQLLAQPQGRTFLKLVRSAIDRLAAT